MLQKLAGMGGIKAPLVPVDIAWRAQPDAENTPFPTFSATYLPFLPPELIKGKIVLIGAVLSITDRHRTPLSIIDDGDRGNMPGVMVQAHGITQMLEGRRPPTVPVSWTIGLLALFALIGTGLSLLRMGIVFNVGISAVGRSNLIASGVRLEVTPSKRIDAFAAYRALWLASRYDSFATTGVRDITGSSGRFAGNQVEARLRYWIVPKRLRLEWNGVFLAKGQFLKTAPNAPTSGNTLYNALNATLSF